MDYDDAIRWLLTLPDFERTGDFADRPDIAPMLALLHELGDPHVRGFSIDDPEPSDDDDPAGEVRSVEPERRYWPSTIHIAGSKGKGSTGAMIEAVLRAADLRTGHYISPHLHRYSERIRIDGHATEPDGFAHALTAVRAAMDTVEPQFPDRTLLAFDALTAAAFVAFREANVDVQIIEVGLGGLLDSTNVFHAPTATNNRSAVTNSHTVVLTPISLEHTAILGDTIQAIARQKAGIITEDCTVIVAPQRESAIDVFTEVAQERNATLIEVAKVCQMQRTSVTADGQEFRLKTPHARYDGVKLPLSGRHQLENAATAIVAAEAAAEHSTKGKRAELAPAAVKAGLGGVVWPGRLEVLKRRPLLIVDGAHNGDSVKRMVAALREDFGLTSALLLFGTLAGKDVAAMAEHAAPFATSVFVSGWPSARAADPRDLAAAFRPHDAAVTTFGTLPDAYEAAVTEAGERGAVVAFGSLAFVAAVREWVLGIEGDGLMQIQKRDR